MVSEQRTWTATLSTIGPRASGIFVAVVAAVPLAGWALDVPALRGVVPGLPEVALDAALSFTLYGIALALLSQVPGTMGSRLTGRGLAAAGCLPAVLALLEQMTPTGMGLNLSPLIRGGSAPGESGTGSMAAAAALISLMLGGALLLLDTRRVPRFAELLAVLPTFTGLMTILWEALLLLAPLPRTAPRSPLPAVAYLVLGLAVLVARPNRGWAAVVTSEGMGGVLARRLLPVAVLAPSLLLWSWVLVARTGMIHSSLGGLLYFVANLVVFSAMVLWSAAMLNRLDATRRRAERNSRLLAEASAALADVADYETSLRGVARLVVPMFADWCAVDVLDEGGTPRRVATAPALPDGGQLAPDPVAPGGALGELQTDRAELIPDLGTRLPGIASYIGVPLTARGRVLGAITFLTTGSGRRFDAGDLAVAEDLARRVSVAIETAMLYRALREADRRKDNFLAVLAHEIRNPLAPICTALQLQEMSRHDAAAVQRARAMMERQVDHLVRLVDDLLDVSRVVRDQIDLRREPLDLATVVARAVEISQPGIDARRHDLKLSRPPEPVWVNGDPVRLTQVVSNLLNNSARYTEPGGRIWIGWERSGDEAVVRVRDTGVGIPPEMLQRVFDMFVRVDHGAGGPQGGLGVGLSLARSLVQQHGGRVEVRSEGAGRGSEFAIVLPALAGHAAAARPPEPAGATVPGAPRRVLIVDDNVDAASSLAMLLQLRGHDARVAYDGLSALGLARGDAPEVALLDLGMPGMDGYELARRFRGDPALREVRLVALTGWGQDEDRQRTKAAGFDHHLVKPVNPDEVQRLLVG